MPHFNHGKFVEEALTAILRQSRQPDEVIVLDDASTDASVGVLESVVRENSNVQLIKNQRNLGPVPCIQRLLDMASGDYVFFAAADDRILPGLFEQSLKLLEAHPEAGLCSSLAQRIDAKGRDVGLSLSPIVSSRPTYLDRDTVHDLWRCHHYWAVGNTAIYRRQAAIDAGGFRPSLRSYVDGFLALILGLRYGACFIPKPLVCWRRLDDGFFMTTRRNTGQMRAIYAEAARLMRTEFGDVCDPEAVTLWEDRMRLQLRVQRMGPLRRSVARSRFVIQHRLPIRTLLLARLRAYWLHLSDTTVH